MYELETEEQCICLRFFGYTAGCTEMIAVGLCRLAPDCAWLLSRVLGDCLLIYVILMTRTIAQCCLFGVAANQRMIYNILRRRCSIVYSFLLLRTNGRLCGHQSFLSLRTIVYLQIIESYTSFWRACQSPEMLEYCLSGHTMSGPMYKTCASMILRVVHAKSSRHQFYIFYDYFTSAQQVIV